MKIKPQLFITILSTIFSCNAFADVWTYPIPGGSQYASGDYSVSIEQSGNIYPAWVHYSYSLDRYISYDGAAHPSDTTAGARGTDKHSAAHFSFNGTVTVRVTVNPGARNISLPLTSAKVVPASYNIPCHIENGNTIVFTLDRPEKVAVIANYDKARKVFEDRALGHVQIQSHLDKTGYSRSDFHGRDLLDEISEGYKNPLFIIALPQETNVPNKNSSQTLIVNPGDKPTQAQLYTYKTVWFAPGIHDLTYMGSYPHYRTFINPGQTFYLEGGSYLLAQFQKNSGSGSSKITGRGMISGMSPKHLYMLSTIIVNLVDTVTGVTVIDRAARGIHDAKHIEDVTMLGAWHGNNNGVQGLDNSTVLNCLLSCHDDNLKLGDNSYAKHIVLWQGANAHPIMVYEYGGVEWGNPTTVAMTTFANTIVEDIDILMYSNAADKNNAWQRESNSAISNNLGRINMQVKNFTYRNIRIESPYLYRVCTFYNLDSAKPYAAKWFQTDFFYTTPTNHTRINGVTFENISVNSPLILYRSLLGSDYYNSMSNLYFTGLTINGTEVTEQNKDVYFEIGYDKIDGLSFQSDNVSVNPSSSFIFTVYPVPASDFLFIKSAQDIFGKKYQIMDIYGKLIQTGEISTEKTLSMKNLRDGTYILKIFSSHQKSELVKFIKI